MIVIVAHSQYMNILRRMTPEQRLMTALELTQLSKKLFLHGLKRRFPNKSQKDIHQLFLDTLAKCWNRNY